MTICFKSKISCVV